MLLSIAPEHRGQPRADERITLLVERPDASGCLALLEQWCVNHVVLSIRDDPIVGRITLRAAASRISIDLLCV